MKQTETEQVMDLFNAPATTYVLPEGNRGLDLSLQARYT